MLKRYIVRKRLGTPELKYKKLRLICNRKEVYICLVYMK